MMRYFKTPAPVTGDKAELNLAPYFGLHKEERSRIAYLYYGGNIRRKNSILCVLNDKGYVCAKDGDVCDVRVMDSFINLCTENGGSVTLTPEEYSECCLLLKERELEQEER